MLTIRLNPDGVNQKLFVHMHKLNKLNWGFKKKTDLKHESKQKGVEHHSAASPWGGRGWCSPQSASHAVALRTLTIILSLVSCNDVQGG